MQNDLITFFSEDVNFELSETIKHADWIQNLIKTHSKIAGDIAYIFCSDVYLHKMNVEHLNHDTLTDIITFDYTHAGIISGDIFISIDRVQENAKTFSVSFDQELHRVMSHGILHLIGFKDKTDTEKSLMRDEEDKAISLLSGTN